VDLEAIVVEEEDLVEIVEAIVVVVDSEETVAETVEDHDLAIGMAVIVVAVEGGAQDLMEGEIETNRGVVQEVVQEEVRQNGPR